VKIQLKISLAIALILVLAACQNQEGKKQTAVDQKSPVIAEAGGKSFHESDIDAEIATLPGQLQYLRDNPELRTKVLQSIMHRHVLSQKAQAMHLETRPAVSHRLDRARESILIQALEQAQSKNITAPTDEEIKAYYQKNQIKFTVPEQVHARHILVSSKKKAEEILQSIHKGEDFSALAAAHSLDNSNKSRGGDLNWFPRGAMVKSFEDAAFAMKKKGALSKPVKTQFGWHIIQLLGRKPSSLQSLDDARAKIVELLHQQALTRWVEKAMQEAGARVLKTEYIQGKQTEEN